MNKEYTLDDFKNAKIVKPKPGEWTDHPVDEKYYEQKKLDEVKNLEKKSVEDSGRMNYNVLKQIGGRLRRSDVDSITTSELYSILRKATGIMNNDKLRYYAKMLRDDGYIKFNSDGVWEIIKRDD